MNFEQTVAVSIGLISLPILYWWAFKMTFAAGVRKGMKEMARLHLDEQTEFEWLMVEYQSEILDERVARQMYEDE
jgi:hypothetical protein